MTEQLTFELPERTLIKGFPELHWTGKHPYRSTVYFPAQKKESFGEPVSIQVKNPAGKMVPTDWMNKIFWGDNLQVMSHLLKEYRGMVDLIYIDPPFDSKADYKKKIEIRGLGKAEADTSSFEEKQYGDIWTNDEYLQFMYERLTLMRELLSDTGSIYLHCDWHKSHHLRSLLDSVFGPGNIVNEIVWCYTGPGTPNMGQFNRKHDIIYWYSKTGNYTFNQNEIRVPYKDPNQKPRNAYMSAKGNDFDEEAIEAMRQRGCVPNDWWEFSVAARKKVDGINRMGYPTEKPEPLLERIIEASSNPGDLVFDCFMGSGTTQAVALKLGRRFLGADINLGAVQTTTKRLLGIMKLPGGVQTSQSGKTLLQDEAIKIPGLEVYNVNNYEIFRNPVEAKELILKALKVQIFPQGGLWDGELDGRMVKVMPVDHIATKADLESLKANLPYKTYDKRREENPNQPVESITIVCMGHEPDLKDALLRDLSKYKIDIDVVDILKEKKELVFKREAEAEVVREGNKLVIRSFYPLNLMQKLSRDRTEVEEWRQLVDSILIDWNFDGGDTLQPAVFDIPKEGELVKGVYDIPETAGRIRVKITDLLSESLEVEVK